MNPTTSGTNQLVRRKLPQIKQSSAALTVFDGVDKQFTAFYRVSVTNYAKGEFIASRHGGGAFGEENANAHYYFSGKSLNAPITEKSCKAQTSPVFSSQLLYPFCFAA